jgi:hypothetical protein
MSLQIFKQNMLSYMQNQGGISSYSQFAKKLTMEYDMAVKRGFDSTNNITVAKGNTQLMEATLNGIFGTALQQSSGEHPIITNMGPAFIAYWTGATMSQVPPPIIPSPGAILNIATISSFITDPGIWKPTDIQLFAPPKPPLTLPVKPTPVKSEPLSEEAEIEELLAKIPDDNNTKEGAAAIVELTGPEVLTDDGEEADPEIEKLKNEFIEDEEMTVTEGTPAERTARERKKQPQRDDNPKEEFVTRGNVKPVTPPCGTKDKLDYLEQLSPNYKVADLSIKTVFKHKIKAQKGLSERDIVCNLKNLAVNILEPLKKKYPTLRVNSGFRGKPSLGGGKTSQHELGEAIDIQFPNFTDDADYVPVAKWVIANLPFDQLIFEHGISIWLHISLKRGGTQRGQLLTMYKGNYTSGLRLYRKKGQPLVVR